MSHLMIISLGPVQEFIASARRSRDLWFGSWLLSELSKAAACKVVLEHDGDIEALVFPKPESIDQLTSRSRRSGALYQTHWGRRRSQSLD
jgi:CRISPR-associated protein Cmr2